MSATELVEDVVEQLGGTASSRTVYGEPVTEGGRTVVPVARVAYGFGGGFGTGDGSGEATGGPDEATGGVGIGGGVAAAPVGALEVTVEGTRFVRFRRPWRLVGTLLVGAVLGWLLGGR